MGKTLSKGEKLYLMSPNKVKKGERGSYKKRIKGKVLSLKDREFLKAMSLVSELDRVFIINNLIQSLYPKDIQRLLEVYSLRHNFLKDNSSEVRLNFNEKYRMLNEVTNIVLTTGEIFDFPDKFFQKKSILKKELLKYLNSEKFVLNRKIDEDMSFIKNNRLSEEIIKKFLTSKKFQNLEFIKNKKNKIWNACELVERGILLKKGENSGNFIRLSKKIILNKTYAVQKVFEKDFVQYKIYPYKFKSNLNEKYFINPLYLKEIKNLISSSESPKYLDRP